MYSLPPLGLINLATVARSSGHDVQIMDCVLGLKRGELPLGPEIYDRIGERIVSHGPQVVGISCQSTTLPAAINIAKRLKKRAPEILTLLGGHNVAFQAHQLMISFPWLDMILEGEGELGFHELLDTLKGSGELSQVKGLWWRGPRGITYNGRRPLVEDLDTLPFPDYSLTPSPREYQDAYNLEVPIAIIETGRGCPHSCIYCSESSFWRRKVRLYSVSRIVEVMERLYHQYQVRYFLLAHDQFTSNRKFVEEFCKRLLNKGLGDIAWYCISRLDSVDRDLLSLMAQAGLKTMCYGIDSGSPRTLKFIRKGLDRGLLFKRVKETLDEGVIPTLSFVIGFPEETEEDIHLSLQLALMCASYGNTAQLIQIPTVLPGTQLFERYKNRLVREIDSYFALGLEFDGVRRLYEDEYLINTYPQIFCSFYNIRPKGMEIKKLNLLTNYFPIILELYPKTFLLLSEILDRYVHQIFLQFLDYITTKRGYKKFLISAKSALFYLKGFIKGLFSAHPYLREIFSYETLCAYARFLDKDKGVLARKKREQGLPLKKVLTQAFHFDIQKIILGIISGEGLNPVERKNFLVFHKRDSKVEVVELDELGYSLLMACDGRRDIEGIRGKLGYLQGEFSSLSERDILLALEELRDLGFITWSHKRGKEV